MKEILYISEDDMKVQIKQLLFFLGFIHLFSFFSFSEFLESSRFAEKIEGIDNEAAVLTTLLLLEEQGKSVQFPKLGKPERATFEEIVGENNDQTEMKMWDDLKN